MERTISCKAWKSPVEYPGRESKHDIHESEGNMLTHWGRMTHICVSKLTIIGSDNGLSPGRRQATIWTNAGILLIGPLGTNFSEILIEIQSFSFKETHLKMSSGKWRPFCLGLNVLNPIFKEKVQGQKHPGRCVVAEPKLPRYRNENLNFVGQNE